jgi:hypothetical protein
MENYNPQTHADPDTKMLTLIQKQPAGRNLLAVFGGGTQI